MSGPDHLHLPFALQLPDTWQRVDAPEGVVVAALRRMPETSATFTPSLTVGVYSRPGPVDLLMVADQAAGRLAASTTELTVSDRTEIGGGEAPGITQVLRVRGLPDAPELTLVQSQVMLVLGHADDEGEHVVLELACTCTEEQTRTVIPEYEQIVASVHLRDDPAAP